MNDELMNHLSGILVTKTSLYYYLDVICLFVMQLQTVHIFIVM